MTVTTLVGLPAGNADLFYAARVEPYRQGLIPRPTPLQTVAVSGGQASFDLTDGIEYVVFCSDGKGRNVLSATTQVSTM